MLTSFILQLNKICLFQVVQELFRDDMVSFINLIFYLIICFLSAHCLSKILNFVIVKDSKSIYIYWFVKRNHKKISDINLKLTYIQLIIYCFIKVEIKLYQVVFYKLLCIRLYNFYNQIKIKL